MPMSKNEILKIQATIHHAMSTGTVDEVIEQAKDKLELYKMEMMLGYGTSVSNKEFETCIEILVQYEAMNNNIGFFKKAKLRAQLILDYS
jgi:hypothetical protein